MNKLEEWIKEAKEKIKESYDYSTISEYGSISLRIIEHLMKAVEYIADIENRVDFRPIESINFDKILSARKAIEACERKYQMNNNDGHLNLHRRYGVSMLESEINLNPPKWYDKFIFWKKRIPEYKSIIQIQKELNDFNVRLIKSKEK